MKAYEFREITLTKLKELMVAEAKKGKCHIELDMIISPGVHACLISSGFSIDYKMTETKTIISW